MKKLFLVIAILSSIIACHKGPAESNQPHHDTTYVWGKYNWEAVWPADKVAASADSVLVDNVFLLSDGESWEGTPTTGVLMQLTPIIESVKPENRYKIRGAGTIINVASSTTEQTHKDSIILAQMGFKFGRIY